MQSQGWRDERDMIWMLRMNNEGVSKHECGLIGCCFVLF